MSGERKGGWALTDHACRFCLGRVLERDGIFMCSVCEAQSKGKPDGICGCGMRSPDAPAGKPKLFCCGENPQRSHSNPARVAILFGGKPVNPVEG